MAHAASLSSRAILSAAVFLFAALPGWSQSAQERQAAAELEVTTAIERAIPSALAMSGNADSFFASARPYGPLDLIVGRSPDVRYASQLRSFFMGAMAGAAEVDQAKLKRALNDFHCGPPCAEARMANLKSDLVVITELVDSFRKLKGVSVLALWPEEQYRIGTLVYDGEALSELRESPMLGLLPWRKDPVDDAAQRFRAMNTSREQVEALLAMMGEAGLVAVARHGQTIRVIIAESIGDNEAGLLFVNEGEWPKSQEDSWLDNGSTIVGYEKLAKGVYFYTSS